MFMTFISLFVLLVTYQSARTCCKHCATNKREHQ